MIVLAACFVIVVAWHLWAERQWQQERQRLLNAILARNAHEFVGLEAVSNGKARKPKDREPLVEQVGA